MRHLMREGELEDKMCETKIRCARVIGNSDSNIVIFTVVIYMISNRNRDGDICMREGELEVKMCGTKIRSAIVIGNIRCAIVIGNIRCAVGAVIAAQ